MILVFLFIFGLVFGSFGYVLALRYDGEHFLLDPKIVGGRSYCPHCEKTLRWFELIPVISFVIQGGQCRNCKARISFMYPALELFSGFLFVAVAARVQDMYAIQGAGLWVLSVLWIAFFFMLFLLSIIDIRLGIIPDEITVFLIAVALGIIGFSAVYFGGNNVSSFGPYASFFGLQQNIWLSHVAGLLLSVLFLGGIVAFTRGKGMGMGDAKLAIPIGFLFGWPDVLFLLAAAFVLGAAIGLLYISLGKKTMKSALPFGPFLALSSAFIFFCGFGFIDWYLHAMGF